MGKFTEAIWKMDKWLSEDSEDMQTFWDIIEDDAWTIEEKYEEMEDFLNITICDEERLRSYIEGDEWTYKELAKEIIDMNV